MIGETAAVFQHGANFSWSHVSNRRSS